MVIKNRKVVIDDEAKAQLRKAYNYIIKDSMQNAAKVKAEILDSIKALIGNPEHHPPDKYTTDKAQTFRAYELHKYRITYHFSDEKITVIRIRHTKMNPLVYYPDCSSQYK